ncbi:DMT family transporter [Streptomyces sp. NPDC013953]|uniref:DMT family transporter n=1 Tax=Streptomyces sp. NPDC013953 TaxID=3364868 RepID=UPI0036FAAB0F
MRATLLALLLSLASAAGYALAAVVQARLAQAGSAGRGALRRLSARPLWWWAVALNAAGALLHVAALHYGPLTLVQALGALTLVAALPVGAWYARRRVARTEWRGALATVGGLAGLVAVVGPAAPGDALSLPEALAVAAAAALLIAVLVRRSPAPDGGGPGSGPRAASGSVLGLATAAGVASAVASALTQTVTASAARRLPGGPVTVWQAVLLTVLVAVFALGGLLLSQAAYRGGLAAPLAVVNLSNPAVAAVIGVALLGETFRAGAVGWLVAAVSAGLAARGVILLTAGPPRPAPEAEQGPGAGREQPEAEPDPGPVTA